MQDKYMTILSGEMKGNTYKLVPGRYVDIGREVDSGIVLQDSYEHVSRRHCKVFYDDEAGAFLITDTSSNGIYLKKAEKWIEDSAYIRAGDIICLGDDGCEIMFSMTD